MIIKNNLPRSIELKIEYFGGDLTSNLGVNEEREYNFDDIKLITIKYGNSKRGRKASVAKSIIEEVENGQEINAMAEN